MHSTAKCQRAFFCAPSAFNAVCKSRKLCQQLLQELRQELLSVTQFVRFLIQLVVHEGNNAVVNGL